MASLGRSPSASRFFPFRADCFFKDFLGGHRLKRRLRPPFQGVLLNINLLQSHAADVNQFANLSVNPQGCATRLWREQPPLPRDAQFGRGLAKGKDRFEPSTFCLDASWRPAAVRVPILCTYVHGIGTLP